MRNIQICSINETDVWLYLRSNHAERRSEKNYKINKTKMEKSTFSEKQVLLWNLSLQICFFFHNLFPIFVVSFRKINSPTSVSHFFTSVLLRHLVSSHPDFCDDMGALEFTSLILVMGSTVPLSVWQGNGLICPAARIFKSQMSTASSAYRTSVNHQFEIFAARPSAHIRRAKEKVNVSWNLVSIFKYSASFTANFYWSSPYFASRNSSLYLLWFLRFWISALFQLLILLRHGQIVPKIDNLQTAHWICVVRDSPLCLLSQYDTMLVVLLNSMSWVY